MTRHQRLAALVCIVAVLWVVRSELQGPAKPVATSKAAPRKAAETREPRTTAARLQADSEQGGPLRLQLAEAGANPFNPPAPVSVARVRVASPAPAPVAPVAVEAPAPPEPPRAPTLPYRFVGMLTEKDAPASVFLALGDRLLQARAGDTLEGGFRLNHIAPRELSFLALPSNLTVRMAVPGEAP